MNVVRLCTQGSRRRASLPTLGTLAMIQLILMLFLATVALLG